jgi:hypothetical protein
MEMAKILSKNPFLAQKKDPFTVSQMNNINFDQFSTKYQRDLISKFIDLFMFSIKIFNGFSFIGIILSN